MTAFIVAACLFVAAVWAAVITYLWRTRDRGPLSVPGRDAPESPAATGPPGSDPQWWLKGEPGIPAGGSNVRPPSLHEGFMAALAMNKRAEDRDAGLPRTVREDYTAPPAEEIACGSCADTDAGLTCQLDLGGRCPSDPGNYTPTDVPPGDTAVPAPASLPEGNPRLPTAGTVSPQEAPAREPSLHAADHMRAEIWATRPWADDTGTFAAIAAGDGA